MTAGLTYTKAEQGRAIKLGEKITLLDQENDRLLEELWTLAGSGPFKGSATEINPKFTPRRLGEILSVMMWSDTSLKAHFQFVVPEYEKANPGFTMEAYKRRHLRATELQEVTEEEVKRIREIDKLHDENEVKQEALGKKLLALLAPKLYTLENIEFAKQVLLHSTQVFHIISMKIHAESNPEVLEKWKKEAEQPEELLVDGEIGIKDVPVGTLLRLPCGCLYRKCLHKRDTSESKRNWTATRGNSCIKLIEPSKDCTEDIYSRRGEKPGSHGVQTGETTVSWDDDFTLVAYPDGSTELRPSIYNP